MKLRHVAVALSLTASALALAAANWPSSSGTTAPGFVIEDGAGNKLGAAGSPLTTTSGAIFGIGSDGTVTINSGTATVNREMNYANLTINGTGHLNAQNGFWIRVQNTLDLTSCPAGGIFPQIETAIYNPTNAAASGATGGTSTGIFADRTDVPYSEGGTSGKTGTTGVGTAGAQGQAAQQWMLGGRGGAAGAGGASATPNAGGAAAAQRGTAGFGVNLSLLALNPVFTYYLNGTPATISISTGGAVGGAGGGDGTNAGGGSGASGTAGGPLRIAAGTINRGASTAASCIAALGENAGASAAGVAGTAGGGGGSGGGAGGWLHLVVGSLIGTTATNALDVSGGAGAAGGNGSTTGVGGDGGQGGNCGAIDIINLAANSYTHPVVGDSAGGAGGAHSGATGGTAGAACNGKANL